jgi:hypothetical protein
MSQAGATAGQYIYGAITPIALVNGDFYYIMSTETSGGDTYYDETDTFTLGFSPGIATHTHSAYHDGALNDANGGGKIYGPVNFKF